MKRSTALRLLSDPYGRAVELDTQGRSPGEIAGRLGVEVSSVGPLLKVAVAKLAALELLEEPSEPEDASLSNQPTKTGRPADQQAGNEGKQT